MNGLLERISYKSICPNALPIPNVKSFSNCKAVIEGNLSEQKKIIKLNHLKN